MMNSRPASPSSLRQRYRWVVGAAQATRWCMKDVGRGIRARHKGSVDMLCYLLAVPATLLLMLQGPLLLLAALLQPLSPAPDFMGDIDGDRCLLYRGRAGCVAVRAPGRKKRPPVVEAHPLFPLFMLPMGFMAVAAAIHPRVAWKPIVHRRASTIDDVLKS